MAQEVRCEELGIVGCDFVACAKIPGEVVEKVVEHLQEEHDMDMPDTNAILKGTVEDTETERKVRLVVERLREAMNLSEVGMSDVESPTVMPPGE
ncbi:MAG: DUF1059 domain-containing protein [Candidatus Bipolaricaulia bacterium]